MLQVEDFVDSGLYGTPQDVIQDALRSLVQKHPDYRIAIAVSRYRQGGISVGRAARIAGVSGEQMKEILHSSGIEARIGPADLQEAREEVETLRMYLDADSRQ